MVRALVTSPGGQRQWAEVDPAALAEHGADVPAGTVYGVALNTRAELARLGDAMRGPPHQAPPDAPVLYVKTPNTYRPHGGTVPVPAECERLSIAATLGVVIGRTACRVPAGRALDHVLGYTLAIDVSEPEESWFRPPVRRKCRDGFLPIGPWIVDAAAADPDAVRIDIAVNGAPSGGYSTADLVRPVAQLIAAVTDFMTLAAGDVLLVGLPAEPATARAGDRVEARAEGIGRLACTLAAETAARRAA